MRLRTYRGRFLAFFLILATALAGSSAAQAQGGGPLQPAGIPLSVDSQYSLETTKSNSAARSAQKDRVSVFIKLKGDSLSTYTGGVPGIAATNPRARGEEQLNLRSADSVRYREHLRAQRDTFKAQLNRAAPSATTTHDFDIILNGISVVVDADQVGVLASLPGVEAIYQDKLEQLTTSRSPEFIGAPTAWKQVGGQASAGEGVIVGIIDSGVWPEHPSFSDPDPLGKPYTAPPAPTSMIPRQCHFNGGTNPGPAFACNKKLIAAYRFMTAYDANVGLEPAEYTSARDDNGHGTHTATTAAGNRGVQASIFGISRGPISGIAPRAYVIAYKVCGDQGCFQSDSVAAIQRAIQDGVNVINFSISGGENPYSDAVEQAFLEAYEAGVFVAASAGNSGPGPETVAHRGPWVTTVAASTSDRHFRSDLKLTAGNGDTLTLVGSSITPGLTTPRPVVLGTAVGTDALCVNPIPANSLTNEIVVCQRGPNRVLKSRNVFEGGGDGMILYNATLLNEFTDNHWVPTVHLENNAGAQLLAFLSSHSGVTATFTQSTARTVKGDVVTVFSSRGGPGQTLGVSKPDVTAPGLQILAGHTPTPATVFGGPPGELFQSIAGTSMSSPHVAGAAAMIKDIHPDWSPGQIKSALMTTAKDSNVFKEDGTTPFTPFDAGSGRIDLRKAWEPGLTFDESAADYIALQDHLWDANYPSLYVPTMPGVITVQRTARSVVNSNETWKLSVKAPKDLVVTVPKQIKLSRFGEATFSITVDARNVPIGEVRHATLILDGDGKLHFPITIVRKQPAITLTKTCDPATINRNQLTTCTITTTNSTFDDAPISIVDKLPSNLQLQPASVTGGATASGNTVTFNGTLLGAEPPDVTIAEDAYIGYVPLNAFGGNLVIGGAGDETIANINVPEFIYAGISYTQIGVTSNGYAVVGGGTNADVDFINQSLPDPTPPNNVLAPFWTDLNPGAGGRMLVNVLTDGVDNWIVIEWEAVKEYSTTRLDTFQIWIGVNGAEDITFAYGTLQGNGDGGFLTVGAENSFGNRGDNYYVDGVGTLPSSANELRVSSVPGSPGETKVITFQAKGSKSGKWQNCAELTSPNIAGTNTACFDGRVK
jgi:subtilisin family serine protease